MTTKSTIAVLSFKPRRPKNFLLAAAIFGDDKESHCLPR